MKRFVMLAGTALVGYLAWAKVKQDREERALWAEVTDSFGGNSFTTPAAGTEAAAEQAAAK